MGASKKMFMENRTVKICECCKQDNHKDNFVCVNCGFDFDLVITENEWGFPEIDIK